jgi:hypothetical protein
MKGWRHLRVDQQIPPREKNETGVYDGRHIFFRHFFANSFAFASLARRAPASLSEKKLTADSRARRVLPLAQATNSRRDGRWDASIHPVAL